MALTRIAYALALIIPAALLGGALISQYVFGLYPCEMCMWQRWPHYIALGFAALAMALRNHELSKSIVVAAALAVLVSGLIGGFHAGVEYGWWEGLTACATTVPASGDMLDSIMNAPLVRCDVAPWSLFGISLAGFNFLLSVVGAMLILMLLTMGRKEMQHG
ncbi:disulfide bond formation protein B [Parasphingorhabdus halotolerans]|uniref:Disulfide bond formation protein B n=1 Tax=Parasphingorhabdus halotolerans TaxID=2725558 RepID=A0A6H2DQ90_9SPHN|nr:disulfide bond formation protein B [Parasphingorhabdus halotolerans]QJB69836.1 disulfide bond formation protein B [Parasphingorhabdus halotolerans]